MAIIGKNSTSRDRDWIDQLESNDEVCVCSKQAMNKLGLDHPTARTRGDGIRPTLVWSELGILGVRARSCWWWLWAMMENDETRQSWEKVLLLLLLMSVGRVKRSPLEEGPPFHSIRRSYRLASWLLLLLLTALIVPCYDNRGHGNFAFPLRGTRCRQIWCRNVTLMRIMGVTRSICVDLSSISISSWTRQWEPNVNWGWLLFDYKCCMQIENSFAWFYSFPMITSMYLLKSFFLSL